MKLYDDIPFVPRLTAPSTSSKYYINYRYGGYCTCIVLNEKTGYVLPNCVGYAQGRLLEEQNINKVDWKLPACNAEDWYNKAIEKGLSVGQTPRLGAVIVWSKGKLKTSSDGCGHVAVVEKIDTDGTITISESGYKTTMFKVEKIKPPYAYKSGYKFLGFIYPYVDFGTDQLDKTVTPSSTEIVHTVVKGDTLWKLAVQYLGSGKRYTEIMALNNLSTTTIRVGQKLKIPCKG